MMKSLEDGDHLSGNLAAGRSLPLEDDLIGWISQGHR
jgi:hypothetical protein